MTLRVYNTLSRKKETFETIEPSVVRMYVCGPTVYDNAHIGHGMSSVVFDMIRRYLEHKGYEVRHVMNFTDVDDKIINRSRETGQDAMELAEHYIERYEEHMSDLNILPPMVLPRVSNTIDEIVDMVETLLQRGPGIGVCLRGPRRRRCGRHTAEGR